MAKKKVKVFLSWSGNVSRQIASVLKKWLPKVYKNIELWISSENIDAGTLWLEKLTEALKKHQYGIICVTADNIDKPWINFEAGAISNKLKKNRVTPLLFKVKTSELTGRPLSTLQAVELNKAGIQKLIKSLDATYKEEEAEELSEEITDLLDEYWEELEDELTRIDWFSSELIRPLRSAERHFLQVLTQKFKIHRIEAGYHLEVALPHMYLSVSWLQPAPDQSWFRI